MPSDSKALLAQDQFLTECLGRAAYSLLDAARAAEAIEVANPRASWMMQVKIPAESPHLLGELARLGFALIDTNMQLGLLCGAFSRPTIPAGEFEVRDALDADRAAIEEISARNLVTSRFHADPRIGAAEAQAIKRRWVGNYFEGMRGERLLVASRAGMVQGFLLTLEKGELGVIDLIALDPAARGKGLPAMLTAAWLEAAPTLRRVLVGTQISNVAAIRAYQKLGFRLKGASYALHRHGAGLDAGG